MNEILIILYCKGFVNDTNWLMDELTYPDFDSVAFFACALTITNKKSSANSAALRHATRRIFAILSHITANARQARMELKVFHTRAAQLQLEEEYM